MNDKFEHGGRWAALAREHAAAEPFLDFSANINPLGFAPQVRTAITENLASIVHYPDSECTQLKEALAAYYQLPQEQLLVGNGAVELIYLLCQVLKAQRALLVAPSFSEYERALRANDCVIDYTYLRQQNDFEPQMQQIIIDLKDHDLIFVGNPNNPTGSIYPLESLRLLVEHAEANGCFVAIDESFMDFIEHDQAFSAKALLAESHNLIVFHSLTKFFALPGLRLGFAACSDPEVCRRMLLAKDPWSVNALAQLAGCASLADRRYIKKSRNYLRSEMDYFYGELSEFAKLKVYEPTVNFILLNCRASGFTAQQLYEKLLAEGIISRNCDNYPGLDEYYLRLAVRSRQENERLLEVLARILA